MFRYSLPLLALLAAGCAHAPPEPTARETLPKGYTQPNGPYQHLEAYAHERSTYYVKPGGWQYSIWYPHGAVETATQVDFVFPKKDAQIGAAEQATPTVAADSALLEPAPAAAPTADKNATTIAVAAAEQVPTPKLTGYERQVWERFCTTKPIDEKDWSVLRSTRRPADLIDCVPLK